MACEGAAEERVIEAVGRFIIATSQSPEIVNNRAFCDAYKEVLEALSDERVDGVIRDSACRAIAALFDSLLKETEVAEKTAREEKRRKKESRAKTILGAISAVVLTTALIKEMPSVALAAFGALVGLLAPNVLIAIERASLALVKEKEASR